MNLTPMKAGPGRPKGARNKITVLLKDAILKAAERAGGPEGLTGYLHTQAIENPTAFMALLGRVLPMQLTDANDGPLVVVIRDLSREPPAMKTVEHEGR